MPLCSGTLVGPGLVLTAAHCGADLGVVLDVGLDVRLGYGDADEGGGGAGTKRVLELEVLDLDAHFVLMDAPGDANLCSGDSGGPVLYSTVSGTVIGGVSAFIYRDDGEQGCTGGQTAAVRGDRARKWLESIESGEEWDGVWRSQGPGLGSEPAGGCASAPAAPILAGLLWLPVLLWRRQSGPSP